MPIHHEKNFDATFSSQNQRAAPRAATPKAAAPQATPARAAALLGVPVWAAPVLVGGAVVELELEVLEGRDTERVLGGPAVPVGLIEAVARKQQKVMLCVCVMGMMVRTHHDRTAPTEGSWQSQGLRGSYPECTWSRRPGTEGSSRRIGYRRYEERSRAWSVMHAYQREEVGVQASAIVGRSGRGAASQNARRDA